MRVVAYPPQTSNLKLAMSTRTLTFTGGEDGNWGVPQDISVALVHDTDSTGGRQRIYHKVYGYRGVPAGPPM